MALMDQATPMWSANNRSLVELRAMCDAEPGASQCRVYVPSDRIMARNTRS